MNKKELIQHIGDVLRANNTKKPISIPKQVFHITDNNGNSADFSLKVTDKTAIFTRDDITAIIDACIYVIQESLKRGEPVTIHGFGSLGLNYRKARRAGQVNTNEIIDIPGHYVPKFSFGDNLRICAKVYEMSLDDRLAEPEPVYDEADGEEFD